MNGRVLLLGTIGMLVLAAGAVGGASGSATLADHNNVSSAQPLDDGTIDGVDIPGNESIYYEIDLADKEQVTVSTEGADQGVQLRLLAPDGATELRSASGSAGSFNEPDVSVTYTANQNGTFYLAVSTVSDSPTTVSLTTETPDLTDRFERNDQFESATELSDGETNGLVLAGSELDYYAVELNDSEQVTFSTDGATQGMRVRMFAPDRVTELRSARGEAGSFNEPDVSVTYTANQNGTFYFELDSRTDRSTNYSLSVQTPDLTDSLEPNDELGAAATLSEGQTDGLSLAGSELDYYAVQLNDSEQITFSTEGASQGLGLRMFAPDQVTELRSARGEAGSFNEPDVSVTYTANQNGTFYFELDSRTDRSTNYSVSVQTPDLTDRFEPNDGFDNATTLAEGRYDDLDLAGSELDYYAVELNDSEQITFSTEGASQGLRLRMFGPDRVTELRSARGEAGSFNEPDVSVTYTANQNGTFYFELDSRTDRSTAYSVSAQKVDRTDEFEPNDEFASAPLLTRGRYSDLDVAGAEQDYYFVPLNASQQVDVSLEETGGDLEATLYAANGSVLTRDDNTGFGDGSVSFSYTVRADGNYYLGITSPSNRSAGYRLVLNSNGTIEQLPTVPSRADVSLSTSSINASEPTDLTVTVTDARSGDAVEGATVSISDLQVSATTDASGVATLSVEASSPGDYPVSVSADGYADASATLTVESNSEIPSDAVYSPGSPAAEFDADLDGRIGIGELGTAAEAYASGGLGITGLGDVAEAYASS
ncbi:pre-peptidase C-terminal domain-containing protein [Halosimplex litoreum]|uniref:Pre-peptidase C-terminal domain-containing protein n=1 Tax=Halosimplex litoreum TaxID=1198301 RepID=A0A7T3FZJ4_9EURY|nr:pre-peptidase C-terminal domain-containing protein [Halosimplex litoreum]QPV63634.1 pre-peptidase C-terminal domain-containing protein [Halosimplex litoreum]